MNQIVMVRQTKILDTIYLKYKTKFKYLMYAMEHYGLNKDEEILTLTKSLQMEKNRAVE